MMKKIFFAGLLLMGVTSCSVDNAVPEINDTDGIKTLDLLSSEGIVACGDDVTWPFGSFDVGKVVMSQDGDNLYVEITANNSVATQRRIVQSRVSFYGLNDPDFPNSTQVGHIGNHFVQHDNNITTYLYTFSLAELRGSGEIPQCGSFYVITWANFTAGGSEAHHFAGNYIGIHGNWKYFEYCVNPCQDDPPTNQICETAFMRTTTTLNSFYKEKPSSNNWGWYLYYNKATMSGDYTYDIYAAAGQNDINKGVKVGTVTVSGDGSYDIQMLTGYAITELHVYRNTSLPAKRQAPGLYRESDVAGSSFYLIIHMKVCWNVPAT